MAARHQMIVVDPGARSQWIQWMGIFLFLFSNVDIRKDNKNNEEMFLERQLFTFNVNVVHCFAWRIDYAMRVHARCGQMSGVGRPGEARYSTRMMLPQVSRYVAKVGHLIALDILGIVGDGQIDVICRVADRCDEIAFGQRFQLAQLVAIYFVDVNFVVLIFLN